MKISRVGAFYVDLLGNYVDDPRRGYSYLKLPKNPTELKVDLKQGFPENFQDHPMSFGIENVKMFLENRQHLLENVDFVTRRGILKNIMKHRGKYFLFVAKKEGSVIYLEDVPNKKDYNYGPGNNLFQYCTKHFEKLIFPGETSEVSNAEGFHVVYRAKLKESTIIYNAEIDGIDGEASKSAELQDLSLVEAKTKLTGKSGLPIHIWTQSYLADVDKIVEGSRDENFILKSIETFAIDDLRPENWKEYVSLLSKVLGEIKNRFKNGANSDLLVTVKEGTVVIRPFRA